ncbi:glycosyltransferase [Gammaproteobacteria bacterium]|nr:glycosyltransferase [Gammaproteobacteria bacterium]
MKICHYLSSSRYAGVEQHVAELATIQNIKHEVTIICNKEIADNYKEFNVIEIKNFSRRSLAGIYKIFKILKASNFDIVHAHASKPTSVLKIIRYFLEFNFIASIHGVKKNVSVFNHADFVIGGSKVALNGVTKPNTVIHNWYQLSKFQKVNGSYAIAVGRLEKVKGFDLLIKSWINIKTPLLIVGSGSENKFLQNLIDSLNLSDVITIKDWVNQEKLYELYSQATLLVISSRSEGGPRVALEALANDLPVLSTDVGHMNIILPKELLASANDLESLQLLLETYVENIGHFNQSAICDHVREEFSLEKQSNKVMKIYDDFSRSDL